MDDKTRIAEVVRQACLKAASDAYEQTGISGLCDKGRWEVAIGAIRQLDIDKRVHDKQDDAEQ